MQAVALFLSAASSLLLPASAPPNFARHAVAPARCALVACAADSDDARPLIGGLPAEEGEGILCRDEESDAWWRATVREIRGSEVLIHFTGCDEAWDTVRAVLSSFFFSATLPAVVGLRRPARARAPLRTVDGGELARLDAHGQGGAEEG